MAQSTVHDNNKKISYSAKAASAGHDIGKPGKNFAKIEAAGDRRYGKGAGARIAGSVLAHLRSGQYKGRR